MFVQGTSRCPMLDQTDGTPESGAFHLFSTAISQWHYNRILLVAEFKFFPPIIDVTRELFWSHGQSQKNIRRRTVNTRVSSFIFSEEPTLASKIATFGAPITQICAPKSPQFRQIEAQNRHFSPNFATKSPLFAKFKPGFWQKKFNFRYFRTKIVLF